MLPRVTLLVSAAAAGGGVAVGLQHVIVGRLAATPRTAALLREPAALALAALASAGLCAALAWRIGAHPILLADWWLAVISPALTVVDVLEHRLPNALTIGSYPIMGTLLGLAAVIDREPSAAVHAVLGALIVGGFFLLVAVAAGGGLGAGDVKLAALTAALSGWYGVGAALGSAMVGLFFGAIIGAIRIVIRGRPEGAHLPLGPAILAGAFTVILIR